MPGRRCGDYPPANPQLTCRTTAKASPDTILAAPFGVPAWSPDAPHGPGPAREHRTETATSPAHLSLEERLEFTKAAMTVRLDEAAVAYEVNTAYLDTQPVDLADVVTILADITVQSLPDLYPTPVAYPSSTAPATA
ncbi:hypothetical protein [Streptomyces sp. NPDC048419]|uniref:hypothetical protein n=1 Tax=Streptomyces sp. NPDC048419 TaxID=3365547 RepID=UPI003712C276